MSWRDQAACKHADPELFVDVAASESRLSDGRKRRRYAIERYCNKCLVILECLEFARATSAVGMIYGGQLRYVKKNNRLYRAPLLRGKS